MAPHQHGQHWVTLRVGPGSLPRGGNIRGHLSARRGSWARAKQGTRVPPDPLGFLTTRHKVVTRAGGPRAAAAPPAPRLPRRRPAQRDPAFASGGGRCSGWAPKQRMCPYEGTKDTASSWKVCRQLQPLGLGTPGDPGWVASKHRGPPPGAPTCWQVPPAEWPQKATRDSKVLQGDSVREVDGLMRQKQSRPLEPKAWTPKKSGDAPVFPVLGL